jgi:hypothetical protein
MVLNSIMRIKLVLITFLLLSAGFSSVKVHVLQSNQEQLKLNIILYPNTVNDLKPIHLLVGLPNNKLPKLNLQNADIEKTEFDVSYYDETTVEWLQIQKLRGMWVGTLKISPGVNENFYYKSMIIDIKFQDPVSSTSRGINDKILESKIINWKVAQDWIDIKIKKLAKVKELPSGQWLKFPVTEDGIYKIEGTTLTNLVPNITNYNTNSWMVFTGSNLGRSQIQQPGHPTPDNNLVEIAVQYIGSSDGSFSENDEILFYGRGPSGFDNKGTIIEYNMNLYFNENFYWILIPDDNTLVGKRIKIEQNLITPMITLDYGVKYVHLETDLINPFESGLAWVEQAISNNRFVEKNIEINNHINDVSTILSVGLLGGSTDISAHPTPINSIAFGLNVMQSDNLGSSSWSGLGRHISNLIIPNNMVTNGDNTLYLTNISSDNYSQPYFDYLTLSYGQNLRYNGSLMEFFTPIHSNTVQYSIASDESFGIWKITSKANPTEIIGSQSNSDYSFVIATPQDTIDRLILFNRDELPIITEIEYIGQKDFTKLANSNIQSDHIIIARDEHASTLNRLLSHRKNSIFASLETIYDEFSGGNPDPMAIRNFIDWTQNNWQTPQPSEVFLVGDADYDYRNITGNSNNVIPTIEVGISNSYATDDRLGTINGYIPEVAFGRFPAQNVQQVEDYVKKLVEFETNPEYGLWRQRITLVADDGARPEDSASELYIGKSHTLNSEILADIIPDELEISKLYMLEYPEESNSSTFGVAKPEATNALFDVLTKGTAIINYIGHGSAHQWAQERLLYQDRGDLQSISTGMKLPLWIAGTCSWGHFDNIGSESFSEELIRLPMNGASAVITTSRAITVTSNQYYEEQLFNKLFPDDTISNLSIGTILQSIKTGNQEGEYFHLFGDPAMKLPLPKGKVNITSVHPDTLLTLEESSFTAEQILSDIGGTGFTIIEEEERQVTREYNYLSSIETLTYKLPGSTLFRGQFSYDDKNIYGQFRIPKDINPTSNSTALRLYISSNDDIPIEGLGIVDSLVVLQGTNTNDNAGPIVTFETHTGRILRSGDHIASDERIVVRVTDPIGVNLTGETGHDIVLTNMSTQTEIIITDDFVYDTNSITTGTVALDSDTINTNIHFRVKAWDSANNQSENEIKLYRISESKLKLFNVTNFPNPFSKNTQFIFELSQPAEIRITIYTLGGKKIMEFDSQYYDIGYNTIYWNGKDAFGDKLANGVYLYKIRAKGENENTSFIGRLAKYE